MTPPIRPIDLPDWELYEHFRDKGLSHSDAVIHVERRRKSRPTPATPPTPQEPSKLRAGLVGGAQAATSGIADEIIGAMEAIRNPNVPINRAAIDSSIQDVRGEFSEAWNAHPFIAGASNVAATALNPLNRIAQAATVGVGLPLKAITYGGVLGGAQGAGEAEGGLRERAIGGGLGTALGVGAGVVVGAGGRVLSWGGRKLFGKNAGKDFGRMWQNLRGAFQRTERAVTRALGKGAPPQTVLQAQEAAHRSFLQKQRLPARDIDLLMDTWRAGGKLPARPPVAPQPEVPLTARPGETVTVPEVAAPMPGQPRGRLRLKGEWPDAGPARESFWAQVHGEPVRDMRPMPDIGAGKTLPYYPRGGQVEQAIGTPPPQSSMPQLAQNQTAAMIEYLKAATPQEIPARIATLKALGIPLTPANEAELIQLLSAPR